MKILLVILCAFLLKAEASAQTWTRISPEETRSLERLIVLKDESHNKHVFGIYGKFPNSLYHSVDGIKWDITNSVAIGTCTMAHGNVVTVFNSMESVIQFEDNSIVIPMSRMFVCGAPQVDSLAFNSKIISGINLKKFSVYDLRTMPRYYGVNIYSYEFNKFIRIEKDSLFFQDLYGKIGLSIALPFQNFKGPNQWLNKRVYINPREINKFYFSFGIGDLFQSLDAGKTWQVAISAELPDSNNLNFSNFYQITFPPKDNNVIIGSTNFGVFKYKETTKKVDTVLHSPPNFKWQQHPFYRKITFKENSDTAYLGTWNGEIYRSTDAGETWSLFASGFSTKPVIGIYASGNDSLIVGTEDGIWANYQLPVSVTEEIPFKNNKLTITPNPANSSLKISLLKTDLPQQLSVYNSLGQLVFKTEFSGEFVWDFNNDIPDGVYTVAVTNGEKSMAKQFVIVK